MSRCNSSSACLCSCSRPLSFSIAEVSTSNVSLMGLGFDGGGGISVFSPSFVGVCISSVEPSALVLVSVVFVLIFNGVPRGTPLVVVVVFVIAAFVAFVVSVGGAIFAVAGCNVITFRIVSNCFSRTLHRSCACSN